jgi:tetratricopeptide (TPR) repeat protein
MRQAYQSAGNAQDGAWASFQLGELYWNEGDVDLAAKLYHRAHLIDPTYVPPISGLAKVAWARGRDALAIRRYRSVVERYPLPEYVIALGDLYSKTGQNAEAERQYALVRTEESLFQANGVNVDLELALFDADHGRAGDGLSAARAEWDRRHGILVADALAWALYRDGRAGEAMPYVRKALGLGMQNALLYFHAGMIERATGDASAARRDLRKSLAINPHFSILHAEAAARTLHALEGVA